jgi:hypothetical protein
MTRTAVNARCAASFVALLGSFAAGCDSKPEPQKPPAPAVGGDSKPAPEAAPAPAGMKFEERAEAAGLKFVMKFLPAEQGENFKINFYDHGCGVAVGDYDGDGLDDVFFCNQLGPCALFHDLGGGKFADVTKDAGELSAALDGKICVGCVWADVDGDGLEDLFVTTVRGGNVLLKNLGGGKFRDATKESGLALVTESWSPCFFDMDGDGDLDLLVTNTAHWTYDQYDDRQRYFVGKITLDELISSPKEPNVLYRNDGKGHFTDVTEASGMRGTGWCGDMAVFDYDGDGALDVFVCNMFGSSVLYHNDGKGKFTDVTKQVLGRTSWGAVGARAFDYDGDGRLDLFVVDMHSDMWMPFNIDPAFVEEHRKYRSFLERSIQLRLASPKADQEFAQKVGIKPDEVLFGNTLYKSRSDGKFDEVSDAANAETLWPWGIAEGDYDCDGFVDAYIPSGMGLPLFYWRNPMLKNRGDGTFVDVCKEAGLEPPPGGTETEQYVGARRVVRSSRAAATADFDGDGRLDLVVNNFNDRAFYFHNVSPARHWCELRLVGTKSNREAIGALVRVTAGGKTQLRQVQAAGGYLSQSSSVLHFGLGDATAITKVEIRWPSGATQTLTPPSIDTRTTVTEPAK